MFTKKNIAVVMLVMLAVAAGGCNTDPTKGYTLKNQYREGINTVAVNIFTRGQSVYRRELEMRLTEAIVKRISLDTPYKIAKKARADTLLSGTIEEISQRSMSYDSKTGMPREKELIVVISLHWVDLRSGDVLVKDKDLRAHGIYVTASPLSEDFFQGSEDALNRLAKRVVEKMEADW